MNPCNKSRRSQFITNLKSEGGGHSCKSKSNNHILQVLPLEPFNTFIRGWRILTKQSRLKRKLSKRNIKKTIRRKLNMLSTQKNKLRSNLRGKD